MLYKTYYKSPIGNLMLVSDGDNLVGLYIENQKYYLNGIKQELTSKDNLQVFENTKKWLDRYFAKENPSIKEIPLAPIGGEFRQKVWKILCEISWFYSRR